MKHVYELAEVDQSFGDIIGRKCANLGELLKMGAHVPSGFVLSLSAYDAYMQETAVGEAIKAHIERTDVSSTDLSGLDELSGELKAIVLSHDLHADLRALLEQSYARLCGTNGGAPVSVAVRSAGARSRPGQYETFLSISGLEDVIEGVQKVWASTFNTRSLAFRLQNDLPIERDPIGVAVIRMVEADSAGVILTVDPNTGDRSKVIIESNWGLGESVVSGEMTPDLYVVNKSPLRVLEQNLGEKTFAYCIGAGGDVERRDLTEEQIATPSISEQEALRIAEASLAIEEHFGVPQDIEWAFEHGSDSESELFILQARAAVYKEQPLNTSLSIMERLFS
jgi:pyruvate,water dikinase